LRGFQNRVLRRISGSKREEEVWSWRRSHNEELQNLYGSPKVIKSRRMIWAGHVARMGDKKCIQYFGWKTWKEQTTWKT
jgi:hypothetical protein